MCDWIFLEVVSSEVGVCKLQQQLNDDGLHWEHCTQCDQSISSSALLPCWKERDSIVACFLICQKLLDTASLLLLNNTRTPPVERTDPLLPVLGPIVYVTI